MTRMNRFSMISVQITWNDTKYIGENGVPHVEPWIQSESVLLQSYITYGQSSPVAILMHISIAFPKSLKFLKSSMMNPLLMPSNMNQPRTEKMKKISISNANTLSNDGNENMMVLMRACRPGCLFISLSNRLTLITLSTLIS